MNRILIVEDDKVGRQVLKLFMQPYGEVLVASRGDEALGAFLSSHKENALFGLILLDLGLPDQDGLDVLRQIRELESKLGISMNTPVIVLTGNTEQEQINLAVKLGASKYLLKPVIESELIAHLKDIGINAI